MRKVVDIGDHLEIGIYVRNNINTLEEETDKVTNFFLRKRIINIQHPAGGSFSKLYIGKLYGIIF